MKKLFAGLAAGLVLGLIGIAVAGTTTYRDIVNLSGGFEINEVTVDATAAELDILDGVTSTATELNYLDITTLGTGAASKAVVLDAGDDYTWPSAGFLTYGGTQVTANGAEMNYLDLTTLGTGAASKAVVLDTGDDYIWPSGGLLSYGGANVTASGTELSYTDITTLGTQQASKALTADASNLVTTLTVSTAGGWSVGGASAFKCSTASAKIPGTSQLLALNATPITIVPAPGANLAAVFKSAVLRWDYIGAACGGVAAGENLQFKYTNGSGAVVSDEVETTGMIDQATDQVRVVFHHANQDGSDDVNDVTPVANAAIVLQLLTGEVTSCNGFLNVRVEYCIYPTDL